MDLSINKREIIVRETTLHATLMHEVGRIVYEDILEPIMIGDKAWVVSFFDIYGLPVHHYFKNKVCAVQYAHDWASAILCSVKILTE